MRGWIFWMGFWFAIGIIVFVFFGIPLIAYLGFTRKLKFLPPMEDLLKRFPDAMKDLGERPPYNKLSTATGMSILYFELLVSYILIKILRRG